MVQVQLYIHVSTVSDLGQRRRLSRSLKMGPGDVAGREYYYHDSEGGGVGNDDKGARLVFGNKMAKAVAKKTSIRVPMNSHLTCTYVYIYIYIYNIS